MRTDTKICLLAASCLYPSFAEIRRVPSDYITVPLAVAACQRFDTVLVAPGQYVFHAILSVPVTIGSLWLTTGDTVYIDQTRFVPGLGKLLTTNYDTVVFAGIHFKAPSIPQAGAGIVLDTTSMLNSTVDFEHCNFEGVFDSVNSNTNRVIQTLQLIIDDCTFYGDLVGAIEFIGARTISMHHSAIFGRGNTFLRFFLSGTQQTTITNCYFAQQREGLRIIGGLNISNCSFYHTAREQIKILSSNADTSTIGQCTFVGCTQSTTQALISYSSNIPFTISDCQFDSCSSNSGESSLIEASQSALSLNVHNTTFQNIVGFIPCIRGNELSIDSCRFLNNTFQLVGKEVQIGAYQVNIGYCDFNQNFLLTGSIPFAGSFDTVFASNCYWGDATGPEHSQNPRGQGMSLPNYVNPFPFLTSPVFPIDGVSEHGITYSLPNSIELLPAYPNPFNSTTTIRYSLPRAEPVIVTIWNEFGQLVTTLQDSKMQSSGFHSLHWSPNQLASGRYYIKLNSMTGSGDVKSIVYLK